MTLRKDKYKLGNSVPNNRRAKVIVFTANALSRRDFRKAAGTCLLVTGSESAFPKNGDKKPQGTRRSKR